MNISTAEHPRHPLGSKARVLLTNVFGPYAQVDGVGSRLINPMELNHNQGIRVQTKDELTLENGFQTVTARAG